MKTVLVLGCGPAGLLAAHAAVTHGCAVQIASKKEKSFISGAQFLHTAIPDVTSSDPDGVVNFIKHGDETRYAEKIYGDPFALTSWGSYPSGPRSVWNLRQVYDVLWGLYEPLIQDVEITPALLGVFASEGDAIFSTIPAKIIFPEGTFDSRMVWIDNQPGFPIPEMTIIYEGGSVNEFYRLSNIFGNSSIEYGHEPFLAVPGAAAGRIVKIRKPTTASFENPYPHVHLLGRYGKWQKGVLVDDAYREAVEIADALQ